jgi:hypothetical protein
MFKCKFLPMHTMKACGRVELQLHSYLTIGGQFHKPTALLLGKMPLPFTEDEEDP